MVELILTLACPDRVGIVHAVSGYLQDRTCNILDSQQFRDEDTDRFFMRVRLAALRPDDTAGTVAAGFTDVAAHFDMEWELSDAAVRVPTLIMVSAFGHCLNDLLYRWSIGALATDIRVVVSNHPDFEALVSTYGVPFHHLPITPDTRQEQETELLRLVTDYDIELVVLARYMQVLSPTMCTAMSGRIINIHHSFLPSFKGARPYAQAHQRGVKLIGATAHYVTADLDEGPIIEQEVARVDHTFSPGRLTAVGRDLESVALARAVQWHAEHRILRNGAKTVVFR